MAGTDRASRTASLALARSFLFLPADRLERLPKARRSGAHAVVIDLEDAVAPEQKDAARKSLAAQWSTLDAASRAQLLVRINAAGTPGHEADLAQLQNLPGLNAVMLPKAESPAALQRLQTALPSLAVLPLVESADGLAMLDALARVPGVLRFVFGHLDFQSDLGMTCETDEAELAPVRLALVLASRRARLAPPVDGVTVALQDAARLEQDCRRTRRFGFGAKLCIHPAQVGIVNRALGPTLEERAWARRVLDAAATHDEGAFQFEGTMVDAPVLARALAYIQDTE